MLQNFDWKPLFTIGIVKQTLEFVHVISFPILKMHVCVILIVKCFRVLQAFVSFFYYLFIYSSFFYSYVFDPQKRCVTELKLTWPVIVTGDSAEIILSPDNIKPM